MILPCCADVKRYLLRNLLSSISRQYVSVDCDDVPDQIMYYHAWLSVPTQNQLFLFVP